MTRWQNIPVYEKVRSKMGKYGIFCNRSRKISERSTSLDKTFYVYNTTPLLGLTIVSAGKVIKYINILRDEFLPFRQKYFFSMSRI